MKFSKKLLSLLLAIVMVFSALSTAAFAWTMTGDVVAGNINYKYTVEKVGEAPMADGSATYAGDDIYAVTLWAQCDDPIMNVTSTFHYDKAHYSPIMIFDGDVTYPIGAEMSADSWYTDMSEGNAYVYSFGEYMNTTGMYKANGTTATTAALAKCIGLGSDKHAGIKMFAELVSPDHPYFAKYSAGVDTDKYGIMFVQLDVTAVTKTAYLNTIIDGGIKTNTNWMSMFTYYFQRNPGVTDADCVGDIFGVTVENCYNVDGTTDASGNAYFVNATTAQVGNPTKNVVSNAVVEGEAGPAYGVEFLKDQIKFETNKDGSYAGEFAYRTVVKLTGFADAAEISANVAEAGFIYNKGAIDIDTAKAQIAGGAATYSQAKSAYVSTTAVEGEFVMACVVYDIPDADVNTQLSTLAYLKLNDGTVVTFADVNSSTFSGLYNQYFSQAFPA